MTFEPVKFQVSMVVLEWTVHDFLGEELGRSSD
jgi:hypothetical protein